jgi:hypothetical protein
MGWFSTAEEKQYGRNWAFVTRFGELLAGFTYEDWELVEEAAMAIDFDSEGNATRDDLLASSVATLKGLAEKAVFPALRPRLKNVAAATEITWKAVFDQAQAGRWGTDWYDNRGVLAALAVTVLVGGDTLKEEVTRLFYSPFNHVVPMSALKGSGPRTGIAYFQYGPNWAEVFEFLQRIRSLTKAEWQALPGPAKGADEAMARVVRAATEADRYDDFLRADRASLLAAALADPELRSGPGGAPGIIAARQVAGTLVVKDLVMQPDLVMLCSPLSGLFPSSSGSG